MNRDARIELRVTPETKQHIVARADKKGMVMSTFILDCIARDDLACELAGLTARIETLTAASTVASALRTTEINAEKALFEVLEILREFVCSKDPQMLARVHSKLNSIYGINKS
jgi:hypothetical protein